MRQLKGHREDKELRMDLGIPAFSAEEEKRQRRTNKGGLGTVVRKVKMETGQDSAMETKVRERLANNIRYFKRSRSVWVETKPWVWWLWTPFSPFIITSMCQGHHHDQILNKWSTNPSDQWLKDFGEVIQFYFIHLFTQQVFIELDYMPGTVQDVSSLMPTWVTMLAVPSPSLPPGLDIIINSSLFHPQQHPDLDTKLYLLPMVHSSRLLWPSPLL